MDMDENNSYTTLASSLKAVVAVFVVTLLMVRLWQRKRYHLPPGPWGLPIVGYLPFFGPKPHITFNQLRKKYGDVISIRMGSLPAIVINGSDTIKEALVTKRDDFAGRPDFVAGRVMDSSIGYKDYGAVLKMHRRIVANVLYTYTNARKNPIENIVISDAKSVIKEYVSHGTNSFCPLPALDFAAFRMIYKLSFDKCETNKDGTDSITLREMLGEFNVFNSPGNPMNAMPWLRYVMPSRVAKFSELIKELNTFRDRKVAEHESSLDETNLRDIADGLIHASNQLTEEEKAMGTDRSQLMESLSTIVGAGSTTISSTLKWCVALMVAFPDVQEEVHQQINTVVGQGRDITLADRAQLPLVEATFYEVLRFAGIFPITLPHATTCDTTLQGYDIPKGTVVMVNLYSVFTDEKLWEDPKVFRPQRFLDSEGQLDQGLVEQAPVFSLGRRRCVGESLARMELFLYFGTLMQRLQFYKPPGHPDYELKSRFSLFIDVEPFEVCVRER
ncbi:hypothetical protein ACOMHN_042044 [Nucella lapillus]